VVTHRIRGIVMTDTVMHSFAV